MYLLTQSNKLVCFLKKTPNLKSKPFNFISYTIQNVLANIRYVSEDKTDQSLSSCPSPSKNINKHL